jgi:hypothetical protein
MKIELKNIRHLASKTQETNCYSASLYVDGKKIGEVSNDGHGGPDMFHGDRSAYSEADKWVKANIPPTDEYSTEMDIELVCAELLDDWLFRKDLKAALRSKVLILKPGDKNIYELAFKNVRKVEDKHFDIVKKKYPEAKVLNTLPFEDAYALYIKNT